MRVTKKQADMVIIGLMIAIFIALASMFDKSDNSPSADWYLERGQDFDNRHQEDKALPYYDEAIRLDPNFAEAYGWRCGVLWELNRFEEALDDCDRNLELDANSVNALANRCLVLSSLERLDEALLDCNRAIELEPSNTAALNNRGLVYAATGDNELAIEDYSQSIEADGTNGTAYYNRGVSYVYLDKLPQAIADFEQAIAIDGQLWLAYGWLSYTYYQTEDVDNAFRVADLMVQRLPYDPNSFYVRATLHSQEGHFAEAEADYLRVLELDESYLDAYMELGYLYLDKHHEEEALTYLCEYLERGGEEDIELAINALDGCPEAEATPEATEAE